MYLPRWQDTLAWASRDAAFLAQMKAGYPRFFIPLVVQELATRLLDRTRPLLSTADDHSDDKLALSALLIASHPWAQTCQSYLQRCGSAQSAVFCATLAGEVQPASQTQTAPVVGQYTDYDKLYLVTYPKYLAAEAKAFWQHTGSGISSRWAVYWLENTRCEMQPVYNTPTELSSKEAETAMITLRDRIARSLAVPSVPITRDHVFLHPTGMSAIGETAAVIHDLQGCGKVAIFG